MEHGAGCQGSHQRVRAVLTKTIDTTRPRPTTTLYMLLPSCRRRRPLRQCAERRDRGHCRKKSTFLNDRYGQNALSIGHSGARYKVCDAIRTSVRLCGQHCTVRTRRKLFSSAHDRRGTFGRARDSSCGAAQKSPSAPCQRCRIARSTRSRAGITRSRFSMATGLAPTIYLADTDLRLGVPAILQRVTQSTSDLHGHTTHAVGRDS